MAIDPEVQQALVSINKKLNAAGERLDRVMSEGQTLRVDFTAVLHQINLTFRNHEEVLRGLQNNNIDLKRQLHLANKRLQRADRRKK